jgi:hypothetical protein
MDGWMDIHHANYFISSADQLSKKFGDDPAISSEVTALFGFWVFGSGQAKNQAGPKFGL